MPNCQKWMALSVLFFLFVAVPAVYAQSDGQESIGTVSSVYFTRDLSEKGLKKLYKKALPSRAGKIVFNEYLPDDYLFNAMDNMLASEQKTDGKEIYDSFLSVLHESHVKPLFPVLDGRKKDLYAWHDFAFVPCLCYAKDYLNGNPAEMCQKLPWFPSDECRDIKRNLEYYGQKITDPKTLVVVSALSVPSAKGAVRREGALQNMMGGNNLFSAASGNRASPLAVIWEKRLTSVDKNTLCVNIIAKAGADYITFHCEASRHIDRTLQLIRSFGVKAGLVFNPATPLSYLDYELDNVDLVLLMSVNPGFGGQSFIPSTLEKVCEVRRRLDAYRAQTGREILLEVDGGVKPDNIAQIAEAGADTFVAGSAVFGAGSPEGYRDVITRMKAAASEGMAKK